MSSSTSSSLERLLVWLVAIVSLVVVGLWMQQTYNGLRAAQREHAAFKETAVLDVYQLERQFVRWMHALQTAARLGDAAFQSAGRLPSSADLRRAVEVTEDASPAAGNPVEALRIRTSLHALMDRSDQLLARAKMSEDSWAAIAADATKLAPAITALSVQSAAMATREQRQLLELRVADSTIKLQAGGVVMLLVLITALTVRARQIQRERERHRQGEEQARLLEAQAKADAANAGKSQFLANMSHELRTPLNGMLGMLSLLEATPVNAQQDDYIQTANRSAKHLLSLLNDILDASALEAGKMTLKPESVNLSVLVNDVQSLMRPVALEKRLVLAIRQDPNLPPWVMADGTRVKQIMLNLVSNALKFSEQGTVLLEIFQPLAEAVTSDANVDVVIRVTDEGTGMSPAVLAKLFQRFEQGDASSARRHGGSGLGLEISRNLARRMGGDIEATSVEGKGSVFTATLRLPRCFAPVEQASDTAVVRREAGSPGLNLVVAEDNAINRKYMEALLRNMGHNVRFAAHGGLAVQEVQREMPDLVLMDLHMPEVDGLQATEAIRQLSGPFKTLPIIALTADVFEESKDRVHAAGMDGFLSKPVNVHALEKMLVQRFGLRGATQALPEPVTAPVKAVPDVPKAAPPEVAPARQSRRRFRPGDVAEHLNMAMIGDLCVGITLQGYQSLLDGAMRADAKCYAELLGALEAGETGKLLELGHSFKGVTASLGLAALSRMGLTIEKQGQGFTADECRKQAESLQECWNTTYAICARMGLIVSS
jgi:signal transduction histidine kinase/CheY-like chemotaxis protein